MLREARTAEGSGRRGWGGEGGGRAGGEGRGGSHASRDQRRAAARVQRVDLAAARRARMSPPRRTRRAGVDYRRAVVDEQAGRALVPGGGGEVEWGAAVAVRRRQIRAPVGQERASEGASRRGRQVRRRPPPVVGGGHEVRRVWGELEEVPVVLYFMLCISSLFEKSSSFKGSFERQQRRRDQNNLLGSSGMSFCTRSVKG